METELERQTTLHKNYETRSPSRSEEAAQPNQNTALRVVSEKFVDTETNLLLFI